MHDQRAGAIGERFPYLIEIGCISRKSWLFAGSDRGAERAAFMATLIMSAKLNVIDPQAWLADVLARIADMPVTRLEELLPWNWSPSIATVEKAA